MAEDKLTNEELVSLIRQGDDGYLPKLWDQVRRFIAKQAGAFMVRYTNAHGYANFDTDDLIDEAYFGMLEAVKRYDPGKAKFLTLLGICIKTSFASVAGIRTQRQDACDYAKSLDAAIVADEETSLYDLISFEALDANISDEATISGAVESVYTHELREALERTLQRIPKAEAHALRLRYFFGVSYAEQAYYGGKSRQYPANLGMRGIWHIRGDEKSMLELIEFLNPEQLGSCFAIDYGSADSSVNAEEYNCFLL